MIVNFLSANLYVHVVTSPSFPTNCIRLSPCRTYTKARRVLDQYQHMPSFHGIQRDCAAIVEELKRVLKQQLDDPQVKLQVWLLCHAHTPVVSLRRVVAPFTGQGELCTHTRISHQGQEFDFHGPSYSPIVEHLV